MSFTLAVEGIGGRTLLSHRVGDTGRGLNVRGGVQFATRLIWSCTVGHGQARDRSLSGAGWKGYTSSRMCACASPRVCVSVGRPRRLYFAIHIVSWPIYYDTIIINVSFFTR